MRPFIDRFLEKARESLGDPHLAKRLTASKLLEDLFAAQNEVWEDLQRAAGSEASIGRHQLGYTLQPDVEFYPLPGNYRSFIEFKRGSDGSLLFSKPYWSTADGIEILDQQRGFRVDPTPKVSSAWTMTYWKGEVILHYAKAEAVTAAGIRLGTPGSDAGERVNISDYYRGSIVNVYSARTGAPQSREVIAHDAVNGMCLVRHPWTPIPTGDVWYEFRPAVPYGYDDVYALRVAMMNTPRRNQGQRRTLIAQELAPALDKCRAFYASNVADRGPSTPVHRSTDEASIYNDLDALVWPV